jgi:hypothetical protein
VLRISIAPPLRLWWIITPNTLAFWRHSATQESFGEWRSLDQILDWVTGLCLPRSSKRRSPSVSTDRRDFSQPLRCSNGFLTLGRFSIRPEKSVFPGVFWS